MTTGNARPARQRVTCLAWCARNIQVESRDLFIDYLLCTEQINNQMDTFDWQVVITFFKIWLTLQERLICLQHDLMSEFKCGCQPSDHVLRFRFTMEELYSLVESLRVRSLSLDVWKAKVVEVLHPSANQQKPGFHLEIFHLQNMRWHPCSRIIWRFWRQWWCNHNNQHFLDL